MKHAVTGQQWLAQSAAAQLELAKLENKLAEQGWIKTGADSWQAPQGKVYRAVPGLYPDE